MASLAMDVMATAHSAGMPHLHQPRQQQHYNAAMRQAIPYLAPVLYMMPVQDSSTGAVFSDGRDTAGLLGVDPAAYPAPPNPGSVGHPDLCSRPCIFFVSNTCANGDACPFCHGLHPKRPVHLDKRNRAIFEKMPQEARAAVLLGLISLKVQERDPSYRAQQLVQALAAAVGVPLETSAQPQPVGKREGALRSALRSMSLRPLLSFVARTASENAPEVASISEELLRHCRCPTGDALSPA